MTPDLGALQTFVAVVEHGGFAEASRRLGISASMVSRRIAALEAQLDVRLIHRTTRGMSLTDAGERFFSRCRAVLADLQAAVVDAAGGGDKVQGQVRLTAPQSLGTALIAPVVAHLLGAHPALRIELSLDERKLDLVASGLEVAVRVGPLPDSRFIARRLCALSGQLYASPAYLGRRGTPGGVDELAGHVTLDHAHLGGVGLWPDDAALEGSHAVRANSFDVLLRLASSGVGLAVLPAFLARQALADGQLVLVLPQWHSVAFEIYAVTPPTPRLSLRAKVVMDALAAYAERPAAAWGSDF